MSNNAAYTSRVIAAEAWLNIRCTAFTFAPADSANEAAAPDGLRSLVALIAVASLAGCSIGSGLDDALSDDADETETASRGPEFPETPEGVEVLRAVWCEDDPSITATDINDATTRPAAKMST